VNKRHTTRSAARPHPLVACRQVLLCAGIAAVLAGWVDTAVASPFAAVDASAAAAPGADASGADASGADAEFDRSLLSGAGQNTTDLARFEHGNPMMPGNYNADIYLNNAWVGRSDVRFAAAGAKASATPCVDRKLLDQLGLHPDNVPAETLAQLQDPAACVSIDSLIPGATMTFDMTNLRLDTTVPQAYLKQLPRGYVSSQYWDSGVSAALLNYNFNGYHTSSQGQDQTTAFLGLNAGFNVGQWYFRQDSNVNWQSGTAGAPAHTQWQDINTYVQRDLPTLRALLTVGDSYTDGQVFDSYALRGIQLATDDRMLPQSLQGYAPIVRGVAQTNAMVTVRQNGVLIYQTTVAPGPFALKDLYPTGYGGSLDVTVTEADGRVSTFSVPYASVVQLLRPGITRFDIAVGQLRNLSIGHEPTVAQATLQHGFNNLLTGYAGIVASQGYDAALLGTALNTRYGAFALDLTQARAQIPGYSTQSGQSMRLSYSKIFPDTNTSLTVAAYRYSTSGYFGLTDAAQARSDTRNGINPFNYVAPVPQTSIDGEPASSLLTPVQQASLSGSSAVVSTTGLQRQRSTFSITMSQQLGGHAGSFYVNGSASDYWNKSGTDTQFQVGYNNSFHRVNYSVSATRTLDTLGRYDNEYLLSFTVPLGNSPRAPTFSLNTTHDQSGGTQEQAMINGTAGSDNQFYYGATASRGDNGADAGTTNSGGVNGGYRSPYALVNASYGEGNGYSQTSLGVSGAVVAHPGGITFGQPMGDTVGIVYVPGAAGARLESAAGARIDSSGYALVPYLTPYILNTIQIDPKGLPLDVQLDATSAQVAPYAGAVVMLKFKTQLGRTVIVRTHLENGDAPPFGAEVFNEKNVSMGLIGQAGQALLRGVQQVGQLSVRWQDDQGNAQSCSLSYQLPAGTKNKQAKVYNEINATCVSGNPVAQIAGKSP
jgi:outer membrane usher protein